MLPRLQLSFFIVFQLVGTGFALNSEILNVTLPAKPKCPVKWSWGPWSECDPVTCTRFRRRRCELPMTCSKEVCLDKAYARQRSVVRRYRPCTLKDTVVMCHKSKATVTRHWGSTPFVNFGSGSRFSAFRKPSRLWRQLTPIYLEEPIVMFPKKKMRRRKGSSVSVRTGGYRISNDAEMRFRDYPRIPTTQETEHPVNSSTSTGPSPFAAFFGQWTPWSDCSWSDSSTSNYKSSVIICAQMRTRICAVPSICGDYVLLHRRRCRSLHCHHHNITTKTPSQQTVSEKPSVTSTAATYYNNNNENFGSSIKGDDLKSPALYQHQNRQLDAAVIPSTMTTSSTDPLPLSAQFQTNKHQCGVSELMSYPSKTPRIIGGRLVPRGKWPWMVVLVNRRGEQFCGGALIANQWVLTAAHCLDRVAAIRIGEHSLDKYDPGEVVMRPAAIFAHPNYNPDDFDSDIGLILMDRSLNYSKFIIPACIPPPERERSTAPAGTPEVGGGLRAGTLCTVVGWGKLAEHYPTGSARPREVKVPIVSRQACRKAYADQLTATQICAGYLQGGRDSCGGDSGGPLMCQEQYTITERSVNAKGETQTTSRVIFRWVVEGLVSHGDGCGLQMKYGVYTRVDAFTDWVNAIVNRPEAYLGKTF